MDKGVFSSHTNEGVLLIDDLLNVVSTDLTKTSASQSIRITSNYLDRLKIPSGEHIAWDLLRSDPNCTSTVVNTLVLGNGNIASYRWDPKVLETRSFSNYEKAYRDKTSGEELLYHDRNEWTPGQSRYAERYVMKAGLRKILNRIVSFSNLGENWDSYGAKPFRPATITRSLYLFTIILEGIEQRGKSVPVPFIAPCSDGGIQFEWEMCNKELTIVIPPDESQPLEYLWVYSGTRFEEQEIEGAFDSYTHVVEAVDCLLSTNCTRIAV